MPRFDKTGPMGMGPMTGRGMGRCRGGRIFGRGMNFCRFGGPFRTSSLSKEEEIKMIKEEIKNAEDYLKQLKKHLDK